MRAISLPKTSRLSLPPWLRNEHPGFRAIVALLTTLFIIIQLFSNMPDSALRRTMGFWHNTMTNLGLYQNGWGMFAATNSRTSTARIELRYQNGAIDHIQYIYFSAGYALTAWNEVMQDLQYDDNRDYKGEYLSGFLRYKCKQYTIPDNPLLSVAFQQQFVTFPYNKELAARTQPFVTKKLLNCSE